MNDDNIVEMDFPEYREEHLAIPDVEDEISFTEHKEEIYRRNRRIAAEEQAKFLKEEAQEKVLRCERNEKLIKEAESAEVYVLPWKMAVPIVIVICIVLFAIAALINKNSKAAEYVAETVAETTALMAKTTATEKVTRVTTERKRRETTVTEEISEKTIETIEASIETTTEAEIPPEVLKTMAVREPFVVDGNSYIYNTTVMSYKFTSEYGGLNEYGVEEVTIHMSVKNLTDYGYFIIPSFRLTNGESGNYQNCSVASYDREHTHFSSPYKYEDDEEWREGNPIAFSFDENGMCEISFNVYFDMESDNDYDAFEYYPQWGFPKYSENSDEGFEIPLAEILKFVK